MAKEKKIMTIKSNFYNRFEYFLYRLNKNSVFSTQHITIEELSVLYYIFATYKTEDKHKITSYFQNKNKNENHIGLQITKIKSKTNAEIAWEFHINLDVFKTKPAFQSKIKTPGGEYYTLMPYQNLQDEEMANRCNINGNKVCSKRENIFALVQKKDVFTSDERYLKKVLLKTAESCRQRNIGITEFFSNIFATVFYEYFHAKFRHIFLTDGRPNGAVEKIMNFDDFKNIKSQWKCLYEKFKNAEENLKARGDGKFNNNKVIKEILYDDKSEIIRDFIAKIDELADVPDQNANADSIFGNDYNIYPNGYCPNNDRGTLKKCNNCRGCKYKKYGAFNKYNQAVFRRFVELMKDMDNYINLCSEEKQERSMYRDIVKNAEELKELYVYHR